MLYVTPRGVEPRLGQAMASNGGRGVTVADAIMVMRSVLVSCDPGILLMSTVDGDGTIGRSDCFSTATAIPSADVLLHAARSAGAKGILFGSRARPGAVTPTAGDIMLTRHLLAAATAGRFELVEHVLFLSGNLCRMKQSLDEGLF